MTADVMQEPLRGAFDVVVLLRLIQVLSPDQACRVLRHVSQAIEPGGAIHIVGQVLDDSRLSPPATVVQCHWAPLDTDSASPRLLSPAWGRRSVIDEYPEEARKCW